MNKVLLALAGAALATAGVPVLAQSNAEEIIVEGRYGKVPDSVKSLSQAVSYADLDLSTEAGRDLLRQRVRLTARFLCNKLGETGGSSIVPSCQDEATRSAISRVGTVEEHIAPRGTTWVRPPVWVAPYPADWPTLYPK